MIKKADKYSENTEYYDDFTEKEYELNLKNETQHFTIHYSEFDNECIDKVSDVLENSYIRITNNFNQQLNEKLIIEIYPNHNQLHTALGLSNAPEWIRGGLGVNKIVIAAP